MKVLVTLYAPCCPVAAGVIVEAETFAQARERALTRVAEADWEPLRCPERNEVQVEGLEKWPEP